MQSRLRVQDVPIRAHGPPFAVPSPYVGALPVKASIYGTQAVPAHEIRTGQDRQFEPAPRPGSRGPEPGKEAPPPSSSSGGVENGLKTCLEESNLERDLHINKISHSVVDLPL